MKVRVILAFLAAVLLCAGCGGLPVVGARPDYVKPTVAVLRFDNRAVFPYKWDVGSGMREILVDRLVATGQYQVVDRHDVDALMRELNFQHGPHTREQGRAAKGRLKNVQYLVKGVVTDFGHVSTNRGALSLGALDVFGGKHRALMTVTLQVIGVESGEILASETITHSVRTKDTAVSLVYKDVGFGGSAFYRTPLGRATAKVIDEAVKSITEVITAEPWQPKLAGINPAGTVVINGGKNRGVRKGSLYEIRAPGAPILDPDTGDVIGSEGGKIVGQVRVSKVRDLYSVAEIIKGESGDFEVGQICRHNGR